jgi:hypothetical protein
MIVLLGLPMAKDIQYPAEAAEFQEKKIPSRSLGILSKPVCISFDRGCLQINLPARNHLTSEYVTVLAGDFLLRGGDKLDPKCSQQS